MRNQTPVLVFVALIGWLGLLWGQGESGSAAPGFGVGVKQSSAEIRERRRNRPIGPGDIVSVSMQEDERVDFEGPVSTSGLINLPFFGRFFIVGKSEVEAEAALEEEFTQELYQQASITVSVLKSSPGVAYVFGAVKKPGKLVLPEVGTMNVMQAVSEAGNVTTWGAPADTYVLRTDPETGKRTRKPVNLTKAFQDLQEVNNLVLHDGDVVFVPSRTGEQTVLSSEATEVIVTGEVKEAGVVEFAPGEQATFLRAVFKAGNFTRYANKSKVRLIRYELDGTRVEREIDAERIIEEGQLHEDFPVVAGDMIIVPEAKWRW